MRTKQILCFILIMTGVAGPLVAATPKAGPASAAITTSFPVLTLITRELTGPETSLQTLAASGEEAHHFEMSPKTLIRLQKQDLIIVNGLGFEHWLPALLSHESLKNKILIASEGVKPLLIDGKNPDPHAWHDPGNLRQYIDNILAGLTKAEPKRKALFEDRARRLKDELQAWREAKQKLFTERLHQNGPMPLLVTAHRSLDYAAQAFHLETIALLGNHEGEMISPRQLTLRLHQIKSRPRRAFFGEGNASDSSLRDWATKTNSPWGGEIWGDSFPLDADPAAKVSQGPRSLLDYLNHNSELLLKSFTINASPSSNGGPATAH